MSTISAGVGPAPTRVTSTATSGRRRSRRRSGRRRRRRSGPSPGPPGCRRRSRRRCRSRWLRAGRWKPHPRGIPQGCSTPSRSRCAGSFAPLAGSVRERPALEDPASLTKKKASTNDRMNPAMISSTVRAPAATLPTSRRTTVPPGRRGPRGSVAPRVRQIERAFHEPVLDVVSRLAQRGPRSWNSSTIAGTIAAMTPTHGRERHEEHDRGGHRSWEAFTFEPAGRWRQRTGDQQCDEHGKQHELKLAPQPATRRRWRQGQPAPARRCRTPSGARPRAMPDQP